MIVAIYLAILVGCLVDVLSKASMVSCSVCHEGLVGACDLAFAGTFDDVDLFLLTGASAELNQVKFFFFKHHLNHKSSLNDHP